MTDSYRLHGRAALRTRGRGKQRNGPVAVTRVNQTAWHIAVFLAGGDVRRLRVLRPSEVLVPNHGRRRP